MDKVWGVDSCAPDSGLKGFCTFLITQSHVFRGPTSFTKYGLLEGYLYFTIPQTVDDRVEEGDNDSVEHRHRFVGIIGIHELGAGVGEEGCGIEEDYNCQVRGAGGKCLLAALCGSDPEDGAENGGVRCHHYTKGDGNDHEGQEEVY